MLAISKNRMMILQSNYLFCVKNFDKRSELSAINRQCMTIKLVESLASFGLAVATSACILITSVGKIEHFAD